MFIVRYSGGLGNQMFQYAFQVLLEKECPKNIIKADLNHFNLYKVHNGFELEDFFNIDIDVASRKEIKKVANIFSLPFSTKWVNEKYIYAIELQYKKLHNKQKETHIKQKEFNSFEAEFYSNITEYDNRYFQGEWQNWKYYQPIENILRDRFQFKQCFVKNNLNLLEDMKIKNSVSIHVRRGDFANNPSHDLCDVSYYIQAIEIVKKNIENPIYYVFSDDINYAKSFLQGENVIYVENGSSIEDMQLMSLCKHHIIANSSYSFWAAFIGSQRVETPVIVAPKYFYRTKDKWYIFETPISWRKVDNRKNG